LDTGSAIVNAMSVDVEDYFHVAALASSIDRGQWDTMEYRAEASTRRLLDLFDQRGVRATFFVLGWVARRSPQLVREIHARGHEVASHGMSHELVFQQTPKVFRAETAEAKQLLEDAIGAPILGYRASTYSITRASLWALDILHDLGFAYDSSIFPVRHDVYGIPDAAPVPSLIETPLGSRIVEFPMSATPVLGFRVPISGGGYFRLFPYGFTRWGLRKLNRALRRPFIFYVHPWEVDPDQPRVRTRLKSAFRHYTNLGRTAARLGRLTEEFRFAPVRDVLLSQNLLVVDGGAWRAAPVV